MLYWPNTFTAQWVLTACKNGSTSLFLMDVLGEPFRILREKSHYSAYPLNPLQNNTKMLKTSLSWVSAPSFKDNSCGAFTVHTISALSSYCLSITLFSVICQLMHHWHWRYFFSVLLSWRSLMKERTNTENNTLGKPLYVKGCGTKEGNKLAG